MPNSTINATTNGLNSTAGNVATLDLQVAGSTVASVGSTGISVTGTVSATGVSSFPAGSNTAPSITFTGDTNTGIYSPTADTIAFTEGGTEAMRIDSSGRVGIGTTSPNRPLTVYGGDGYIQMLNASTGTASGDGSFIGVEGGTTALRICNQENDVLTFHTNGIANERGRFDNLGNFQFNSGYGSVATAYGCRAWVNFNGTATPITIRGSGNVTSITDNGTGDYTVNFTTAMPDANYSMQTGLGESSGNFGSSVMIKNGGTNTSSACQVTCKAGNGTTLYDYPTVCLGFFR